MIVKNPENYELIGFSISHLNNKKYDAILKNKLTNKLKLVPFGQKSYEHYKDNTLLKLYSDFDHLDKERRKNYRLRHKGEDKNKFSSGYFSWKYLWT